MSDSKKTKLFSFLAGIFLFLPAFRQLYYLIQAMKDMAGIQLTSILYFFTLVILVIMLCSANKIGSLVGMVSFSGVKIYSDIAAIMETAKDSPFIMPEQQVKDITFYAIDLAGFIAAVILACLLLLPMPQVVKSVSRWGFFLPALLVGIFQAYANVVPCVQQMIQYGPQAYLIVFFVAMPILLIAGLLFAFIWMFALSGREMYPVDRPEETSSETIY